MPLPKLWGAPQDRAFFEPDASLMAIESHPSSVLVLGANGRLGRAAALAFACAGWRVIAQVRRAPRGPLPHGVRVVEADALDLPALIAAGRGADVIVHALNPDYANWDTLLPPLTSTVIELAEATGATLMLPGNVYNFGRALPPLLAESTPFVGDTPKARLRIELEAALQTAKVRTIVIRAGDFLGDAGSWFDLAIARHLARGKVTRMGADDLEHAWAFLPDLAQVFVQVARRRDALAPHSALHYAGLTLTGAELHAALESAVGHRLRHGAFPWALLRLASPFSPMLRALVEMRYLWQRPHRLDETRLRALVGAVPHTPLDEVLRACVVALPGGQIRNAARRAA